MIVYFLVINSKRCNKWQSSNAPLLPKMVAVDPAFCIQILSTYFCIFSHSIVELNMITIGLTCL